MAMGKKIEIRCPIYGFIELDEWEYEIISQPAFQRLRRIRQLALTDYIYPGAMHTRFEHSLGVMHMVTELFDGILKNSHTILLDKLEYKSDGLNRIRKILRLVALLHDVGHPPFSHAAEDLFPLSKNDEKYEHEDYSIAIICNTLRSVIEDHPHNKNFYIRAEEIAGLIKGNLDTIDRLDKFILMWKELISGQVDADRMDYLLRDSHHCGVEYGKYDWKRLVNTIKIVLRPEMDEYAIGFSEGGWHAAESLIVARYLMFTQVYGHKTRLAYNHHLYQAMLELLPNSVFPAPENIEEFLKWDDWRVLGLLAAGKGGDHGKRICNRNHFRKVFETGQLTQYERVENLLKDLAVDIPENRKWYKNEALSEILIEESRTRKTWLLSQYSNVVRNLIPSKTFYFYVDKNNVETARDRLKVLEEKND